MTQINNQAEKTFFGFSHEESQEIIKTLYNEETGRYAVPYNPYVMELTNVKAWHDVGYTGKGLKVAIMDTGVMTHHPCIKGKIADHIDFTGEGIEDLNGHGTLTTLIYLMGAPDVELYIIKVLDKNKSGFESHIVEGIRWAIDKGVGSLNMSFGQIKDCTENCNLKKFLKEAIEDHNFLITAAAGNNPDLEYCPAKCKYCISVGSTDTSYTKIADYSSKADFYMNDFYFRKEI